MQIVTWNVNSVRARLERVLAWIDRVQPDLVCLQELKCQHDQFPAEGFVARGYQAVVNGQKTYNGVAILSRGPLEDPAPVRLLEDDDAARVVTTTVGGIRLVDVYVPNGKSVDSDSYVYKLRWIDALDAWLRANHSPDQPLVLCGDFNIAPDDRDVWDPAAWHEQVLCSTPERERYQRLLSWGLHDALRHFTSEPAQYTWWDYRNLSFQKRMGLRIDHFLVTAPVLARAKGVRIDREERKGQGASDHAPVILEIA